MGLSATHDVVIKTLGTQYPTLQVLFFSSPLFFPPVMVTIMRDPTPDTLRPADPAGSRPAGGGG